MANLYFYKDSSCSTQLSHSDVSITDTTLTAAALISYPGTAPDGQELDYWMISGKLAGLSDIKAEEGLDVSNYIVSDSLMLYPVWRTVIMFTPTAISNIPQGNIVAPQGAIIRYGSEYNTTTENLTNFLTNKNYDIIITNQDTDETLPASQITFTNGDTSFTATDMQQFGAEVITKINNLTTSDNSKVEKAGSTMTGDLIISNSNIILQDGALKVIHPASEATIELNEDMVITMSDISNFSSYQFKYDTDTITSDFAIIYSNKNGNPVYIVGVADPINDTGVANRRYVLNAIGAATTDIKTYIDTAIEEKIADAIGGSY